MGYNSYNSFNQQPTSNDYDLLLKELFNDPKINILVVHPEEDKNVKDEPVPHVPVVAPAARGKAVMDRYVVFEQLDIKGDDRFQIRWQGPQSASLLSTLGIRLDACPNGIRSLTALKLIKHYDNMKGLYPTTTSTTLSNRPDWVKLVEPLTKWMEPYYNEAIKNIQEALTEGQVKFDSLWWVFKHGTKCVSLDRGSECPVGFEVTNFHYGTGFIDYFMVEGRVVKSNGKSFFETKHTVFVPTFRGSRHVDELPLKQATAKDIEGLTRRGETFTKLGLGAHYMEFEGSIFRRMWSTCVRQNATGRVVVDGSSFQTFHPQYEGFKQDRRLNFVYDSSGQAVNTDYTELTEDAIWRTWPTLAGFSMLAKEWGELQVDKLSEVKFDDEAFGRLVMDEDKKIMVLSLVENRSDWVGDVVHGKGGGCIFCLHGPPGTGKTLTAESVSEYLHRPLYSVSVGELGTSPADLEKNLRQILEVASIWNAVVLIDEADIFLEQRNSQDIVRNAMVGIFLRLLEYHDGVLFLTTNRVNSFDRAFHSRISVALYYAPLDREARKKVWKNFLAWAQVEDIDADVLSEYELNGRQIRNSVRLAQNLALTKGEKVGMRHFERTILINRQFEDMRGF